jgi:elongation factor Ts
MITAQLVKDLREKTGAGMMDCKKVLTETDGDMEKAIELLRERGIAKAAKKSSRVAAEGLVDAYVSEDGKVGAIVEVNSETDFVAKNAEFQEFVKEVAKIVAEKNPADVDSLLEETYESEGKSVKDVLTDKIAKIGENMTVRRFVRYETDGFVETYIHGNGKIAVIVDMAKGDHTAAKDVCMQIAAARPEYLNEAEVPQERLDKEMEILKAQAMNEGKPEAIAEKIVQGRIGKFYSEICLLNQEFVKNPDIKVSEMLKQTDSEVKRFARFEKGEGIEKKEENFAEEVMKQLQ